VNGSIGGANQRSTLKFRNYEKRPLTFAFEPMGWFWEMEPESEFELILEGPVFGDPSFNIHLENDVLSVYDEEVAVIVVKKNGEIILDLRSSA
jgi:hypothetical protein